MTLEDARLYLVAEASMSAGASTELIPELARAGVDIYQLRDRSLDDGDLLKTARRIATSCQEVGIPFIVNDRPDIALMSGADGVHVGQDDLPPEAVRQLMGDRILGGSTHSRSQIDTALEVGWDYFAVGPIFETPTKPGRAPVGLELIKYAAAAGIEIPWFAIGGIDESNVGQVLDAGARRIVVVRAIAEQPAPTEAAARLRARLDEASL